MAATRGLRVRTKCTTLDQFVSWFKPYCGVNSFFLSTSVLPPLGAEVPFSFDLADGTPALAGLGGVRETWPTAANRFGRPGMMIELRRLTESSAPVFERIKRVNAEPANEFELDVPTEHTPASSAAPIAKHRVPDEPWDVSSAPVEKIEMVEVAASPAKRRPAAATERLSTRPGGAKTPAEDDPDEAAFTNDDMPTTLAHGESDGMGTGEDAYVQMAPIADALEISIPPDPMVLPLPAPVHAEPEASNIIAEPLVPLMPTTVDHAQLAAPPRRRGWLIAIAVIAALVLGVGLVVTFLRQ